MFDFAQQFHLNALIVFGVLLVAGYAAGEWAQQLFRLPRLTGYLVMGMLLGPHTFGVLDGQLHEMINVLRDVALSLLLLELGQRFNPAWLRKNPWLVATSLLEGGLSFLLVYGVLILVGVSQPVALFAGTISISTSPLIAPVLAHELRAEGQVIERTFCLVILNSVTAFLAISILIPVLGMENAGWQEASIHSLYLIFASGGLALLFGYASIFTYRLIRPGEQGQIVLLLGFTAMLIGLVMAFKLSALIALITYGLFTHGRARELRATRLETGPIGRLFVIVLFVVSGTQLTMPWQFALPGAMLALLLARIVAKTFSTRLLALRSGITPKKALLLGVMLWPMSITEFALVLETAQRMPEIGPELIALVLPAIAVMELLGPITSQMALRHANETYDRKEARIG